MLQSKSAQSLTPYFPELVAALSAPTGTPDRALAARWLAELGSAGLDGVVAKRAGAAYAAGRWSAGRNTEWQPLEPRLVCEVRYDHFSGRRFRHGAKFLRWRPDKDPRLCTFAQLEGRPDRGLEQFWSRQRAG